MYNLRVSNKFSVLCVNVCDLPQNRVYIRELSGLATHTHTNESLSEIWVDISKLFIWYLFFLNLKQHTYDIIFFSFFVYFLFVLLLFEQKRESHHRSVSTQNSNFWR